MSQCKPPLVTRFQQVLSFVCFITVQKSQFQLSLHLVGSFSFLKIEGAFQNLISYLFGGAIHYGAVLSLVEVQGLLTAVLRTSPLLLRIVGLA